jgi:prolyl 4-hydroxylase
MSYHYSYEEHHDYIYLTENLELERQEGHRILTVFLYLNNVEAGGGTAFTHLDITVMPEVGKLLLWPSVLDGSPKEIDWRTEHEAEIVLKGQKYGANLWFHTKPYQLAYKDQVCQDDDEEDDDDDETENDDDIILDTVKED